MASNNQMRSQSYNGGSGKYTASGFVPAKSTSNGKQGDGCALFVISGFMAIGGILAVLAYIV